MKKVLIAGVVGIAIVGSVVAVQQAEPSHKEGEKPKAIYQTKCPLMGRKIDKDLYVDHEGQRVYVCCRACVAAVQKDPEKYVKKLESEGITVPKIQTKCPVMGGKINKDVYVDHDGKRVYLCCPGCVASVKKDPGKYIKKLEDQGIALAKVQTTCPVMGGEINKDLYVDHDGKRIYVCCPGCIEPVKKDPGKYIKQLEAKGVVVDPAGADAGDKKGNHDAHGGHEGRHH